MRTGTVLIIEDEKPNADRLRRILQNLFPELRITAVLESVTDSVAWFAANPAPDLVLMDVRLSDGLSFDIFNRARISAPVIFTTAYDEYAVQAFRHNGIDYLLKPVEAEELKAAVEKSDRFRQSAPALTAAIDSLRSLMTSKEYRSRFLLPYRDGYKTVLVSEVMYFHSELKITHAKLRDGRSEIVPQTLEELEQELDPKQFFRVNRQYIIHIDAIRQVHNFFNGKLKLELKQAPELEVLISREKAAGFKAWLDY